MATFKRFEEMHAWQSARDLVRLVYEITKPDHHHLICRKCGGEVQIDHTALEQVYSELEEQSGFRFIDSHVTFFGLCPECQNLN